MGSMFDLSVAVRLYLLSCFVVSVDFTLGLGQSQDTEFTFQLPAGRTECFYQTATKNGSLEVEYQVAVLDNLVFCGTENRADILCVILSLSPCVCVCVVQFRASIITML